jgi:hypothetical protein
LLVGKLEKPQDLPAIHQVRAGIATFFRNSFLGGRWETPGPGSDARATRRTRASARLTSFNTLQ